jgi:hypothetical protein
MHGMKKAINLALVVGGLLVSAMVLAGDVAPYANGPWLIFSFAAPGSVAKGCQPADPGGSPCWVGVNSLPADTPPWTFAVGASGATLAIVDIYNFGDVFAVYDYGVLLGQTSPAISGGFCSGDPDACVGTGASYGQFVLSQGVHSITLVAVATFGPMGYGAAAFRVDGDVMSVPPPPVTDTDGDGLADDVDACPTSVRTATVVVGTCDSQVPNELFANGCTIADKVGQCTNGVGNHGMQSSCASRLLNSLKKAGTITGAQKDALQSCVARSN